MQYEGRHLKRFASTGRLESLEARPTLSEIYHENSKLSRLISLAYGLEIERLNNSPLVSKLVSAPYKLYSLGSQIALDSPAPQNELERAILGRRSVRDYSGEPLSLTDLARLLFFGYGITDRSSGFRAVASGGALYPLEIYVLPLNVSELATGVYHYNIEGHGLDVVRTGDIRQALCQCITFRHIDLDAAAMVLVITAIFQRSIIKYKDRGYRLILLEVGEVAQNLSLTAAAMDLGACMLGGFLDDELSEILEIDGSQEAPLLPMVFGRPRQPRPAQAGNGQGGH